MTSYTTNEKSISRITEWYYKVVEYLKEKDAMDLLFIDDIFMILDTGPITGNVPDSIISMTRHFFKTLKEEGYDFDRSYAGINLLGVYLLHTGQFSVELVRNLLECGASLPVGPRGLSLLSLPMVQSKEESCREVLVQKFSLLIKAGVDVNFVDKSGATPSDHARNNGCWDEWCRALESNNLSIEEVLEDHNRQLRRKLERGVQLIDALIQDDEEPRQLFWPPKTRKELVEIENTEDYEKKCLFLARRLLSEQPQIAEKIIKAPWEDPEPSYVEAFREWRRILVMEEQDREAEDSTEDASDVRDDTDAGEDDTHVAEDHR